MWLSCTATSVDEALSETLRLPDFPATSSFYKQLDNFVESIRGNQKVAVDGWQAARVLELIEDCYAHRGRIPEPWSQIAAGNVVQRNEGIERNYFRYGRDWLYWRQGLRTPGAGQDAAGFVLWSTALTVRRVLRVSPSSFVPAACLMLPVTRTALGDAKIVIHCGLGNARGIVKGTENLLAVCADSRSQAVHPHEHCRGIRFDSAARLRNGGRSGSAYWRWLLRQQRPCRTRGAADSGSWVCQS